MRSVPFQQYKTLKALRFFHFNYITDPTQPLHMNNCKKLLNSQAIRNEDKQETLAGDTFAPPGHSKASTMRPTSASMSRRCASRCRSAISIRILCVSLAASILLSSARRNPSPIALSAPTTSLTPSSSPESSRLLFLGGEAGGERGETAGDGDGGRDADGDWFWDRTSGEGPSRRSLSSRSGQGRRRLDRRRRRSFSTLWRHCLAVLVGAAAATAAQSAEVRCSRPTARRRAV
uniref:Uncharacterized protein n=1 Tax=Arundo donax TaxID=35708 RepID=A0A0A9DMD8_ARUDO